MIGPIAKRPRPIGGTIGLFFGGLWSILGARALPHEWRGPAVAVGIAITLMLAVRLWRAPAVAAGGARMFRQSAYIVAVAIEIAAIVAAANLLQRHGLAGFLLPAVGVIVGLHFIGLWLATRAARFLWIAGAMCAASALSALLPAGYGGFDPRDAACGFANALVLWIGASLALSRVPIAPTGEDEAKNARSTARLPNAGMSNRRSAQR